MGAAKFSVTPRLILTPNTGQVGSTVTAQGDGFGSLEKIDVYWNSPQTFLGTASADVNGTFAGSAAITFTVPAGALPGVNRVRGKGETTKAHDAALFTVE